MEYQYTLEPYNGKATRYTCPACGKAYQFTKYIDMNTGEHISDEVGICNRRDKCGYHYPPKQYFEDNNIESPPIDSYTYRKPVYKPLEVRKPTYIPDAVVQQSLQKYEENNFFLFLSELLGHKEAVRQSKRYLIGTATLWEGSTVFWQMDRFGKTHTGKIMLYNRSDGKRVKEPYNHITWSHSVLDIPDFQLKQCLYGEHLLNDDADKIVAIVESEKTAIIASALMPDFIWIAAGGLSNLKPETCLVLKGRTVVLFPDNNCYNQWSKKASEISKYADVGVSRMLEDYCSENGITQGYDIADLLIMQGQYKIVEHESNQHNEKELFVRVPEVRQPEKQQDPTEKHESLAWDTELKQLEEYFTHNNLPEGSVRLNPWTTIVDVKSFVSSHLSVVKANNGKRAFRPYVDRLKDLKVLMDQVK